MTIHNSIAIILCAGYGTRMYPLTKDKPKPLLPIIDKPALDYIIEEIIKINDINNIYIVTNDRFFKDFNEWKDNWAKISNYSKKSIHILNDGSTSNINRLGVVRDLNYVFKNTSSFSQVLLIGGDNIPLFSLNEYWMKFLKNKNHCVFALKDNNIERLRETGVLLLSKSGQVLRIYEKPSHPPSNYFSPLIYFLQSNAKSHLEEYLDGKTNFNDKRNFIDYLCKVENVYAFFPDKGRLDIGNMNSYKNSEKIIKSLFPIEN